MSKTTRSTRECTVNQIQPALRLALADYFSAKDLGELETSVTACCETAAVTTAAGGLSDLFNPGEEKTVYTAIVLTERELVWAWNAPSGEAKVVGADLVYIVTRMNVSLLTKDVGLQIVGLVDGAKGNIRGVIGLGPEPDAERFCEQVRLAVEKANPGVKRKWPAWMGGSKE